MKPWTKPGVRRNRSRVVRWARLWRTRRPVTFTEKVRYKMLRDHRPLQVVFADKAAMRAHVAALVGEDRLPRLVALLDDPALVRELALPEACVVKPTHGSGACVVVSPTAPPDARLPPAEHGWVYAHVRSASPDDLAAIAEGWCSKTYGRGPNHEWAYGQIRPQVLVEELLHGADGLPPADHKLFVFHGRCRFVQVDEGRFGTHTQDFFDRDWTPLDLVGGHPRAAVPPRRPAQLEEMVQLAERLGAGTDFVRVDLFVLPDRVLVGELTSSPAGGDSPFDPPEWDAVFGEHWQVPRRYR